VQGTLYRWDVTACTGVSGTGTCITGTDAFFSTQATSPILAVTPTNTSVAAASGVASFVVNNTGAGTMNYSATVTSGSTWLSITSGGTGGNSGIINVTYATNTGAARTGTIQVGASGAVGSPITITITQWALGQGGPSPLAGKGDWIHKITDALSSIGVSNTQNPIQSLIDYEKSKGVQYLIVKAGGVVTFTPTLFCFQTSRGSTQILCS
jgi:BACON domain-containing protein